MEAVLRRYFQAWLDNDGTGLTEIFSEHAVYSECYGPEYHGLDQIQRWFHDWNERGKVLEWTMKRVMICRKTLIASRYFRCVFDGKEDGFDGVTIADFDDSERIVSLSEFQSESAHYYPYGV